MIAHEAYTRSVRKMKSKRDHQLIHGEEAGMVYKYDLPVINLPIKFKKD